MFSRRSLSSQNPKETLEREQFYGGVGITFRFFLKALQGKIFKETAVVWLWTWMNPETASGSSREFLYSETRLPDPPIPVCWAPSYVTLFFFFPGRSTA